MKKVITRHIYTDAVDRANQIQFSPYENKADRRRSETVERSFADAKQHHGDRYARFFSKLRMIKIITIAAYCYS